MIDETLRRGLLELAADDLATRSRLAADGTLFGGYHPEMQAVHDANAAALDDIVTQHGWPGAGLADEDGAEAAWLIAQHAIALPGFQRRCLAALESAAAAGSIPKWQPAYLADRIRTHEGRPQLYGTQFDWDDAGEMSPLPIEEPDAVDARRAGVGLGPLAEKTAQMRAAASKENRPADLASYRAGAEAWARQVGWR